MKRYTTAQAIAILSKPGREGWYAVATDSEWQFNKRLDVVNNALRHHYRVSKNGRKGPWVKSSNLDLGRSDWRIIKPKRERPLSIGFAQLPADVVAVMKDLTSDGSDYEIFARRVGK